MERKPPGTKITIDLLVPAKEVNAELVRYMSDDKKVIAVAAGFVKDLLTGERLFVDRDPVGYSDGKYFWDQSLVETMKRHHLTLKEEIVKNMLG